MSDDLRDVGRPANSEQAGRRCAKCGERITLAYIDDRFEMYRHAIADLSHKAIPAPFGAFTATDEVKDGAR